MRFFVDFVGHSDLYYSMHLLFEKRLGHELYRPTGGKEWEAVMPWTSTPPPGVGNICLKDEIQHLPIVTYNYEQKLITLSQFKDMDFDFIVATGYENEAAVCDIVKNYKPKAKAIRHIANIREKPKNCKNILLSTLEPMPSWANWIRFCPEHRQEYLPLENYIPNFKIKSFFNYMRSYPDVYSVWNSFKDELKEYTFFMHGGEGVDLSIPQQNLPEVMQDSMFIWHTKPHGGCGYVARQSLSCGKPLIVNKAFCKKHQTLASEYLIDGKNCIDIDPAVRTAKDAFKIIREWSNPEVYAQKAQEARNTFVKTISFENEANNIQKWLCSL
jgi:glycosyltransferase involved in cell wall biosynthesis